MAKYGIIDIHQARGCLYGICRQAAGGEEVILARHGLPWVRVTSLETARTKVQFGVLKGAVAIEAGFDAPLPLVILQGFDGI